MSAIARWWEVTRREVLSGLRRPAYWVLFVLLALLAWGFSEGGVTISSGDSTIGGEQAHVTSMFGQGMIQTVLIMGFGAWFLAIAAGLVVIRDLELGVVELFHSTRLTPREYVWGKFAGALGIFLVVWLLYLGFAAGLNHIVEGGDAEHIGTFALGNYLYPTLLFGLPQILLFAGVPFFLGTWTRQPIVVFAFPVAVLLFTLFFLTTWSPDWLSPETNRLLMLLDPSGFRWLNETFLTVDRGSRSTIPRPFNPIPASCSAGRHSACWDWQPWRAPRGATWAGCAEVAAIRGWPASSAGAANAGKARLRRWSRAPLPCEASTWPRVRWASGMRLKRSAARRSGN